MKKLLLGSMSLLMFSLSVLIVQISCQKGANSQGSNGSTYILPPATTTTLGGVIIGNGLAVTSNGTLSVSSSSGTQQNRLLFFKRRKGYYATNWEEIWTVNYDGTNAKKINIVPPQGMSVDLDSDVTVTPDGQRIFVGMKESSTGATHIYSYGLDGTNPIKVVDGSTTDLFVGSAY
jgi:hypothetical protein